MSVSSYYTRAQSASTQMNDRRIPPTQLTFSSSYASCSPGGGGTSSGATATAYTGGPYTGGPYTCGSYKTFVVAFRIWVPCLEE